MDPFTEIKYPGIPVHKSGMTEPVSHNVGQYLIIFKFFVTLFGNIRIILQCCRKITLFSSILIHSCFDTLLLLH